MTTRRSFLKSLVGIVASVALAQRAVMESINFESFTKETPFPEAEVNPAWVNAPYEVVYLTHPEVFKVMTSTEANDDPRLWEAASNTLREEPEKEARFVFTNGEFRKVAKHLA